MENQVQNQQPDDLEQNEQGQGSSGMEQQQARQEQENTDTNQNDLAGNANGNDRDRPEIENDTEDPEDWEDREQDPPRRNESLPTDGPVSQEEGDESRDLNDIETDDDDEFSVND